MNGPPVRAPGTPPAEEPRSGEGAETALKALIRKRKQSQPPEDPELPPAPPPVP